MSVKLSDVYRTPGHRETLYALLKERKPSMNIHHKGLPSFKAHKTFVQKKPYAGWYFIKDGEKIAGTVLLDERTGENEIGVFIFKKFQKKGYAAKAVKLLMGKFKKVKKFVCFINPRNTRSIDFFERMGFKHVQNTYEYRRKG